MSIPLNINFHLQNKQGEHNKKPKIIVILGPTGSGKTSWAFKLCKEFSAQGGGEIVSADSRQIYKGMNIGTNKTIKPKVHNAKSPEIKEHLIDIVNPDEILTLPQYKKLAIEKINNIILRGKIPLLAGGTGLYISAIVDNLEVPEIEPDWQMREELNLKSIDELQKELEKLDSETYKKIDLNNKRRLIRAIEVCKQSGKPFSSLQKKGASLFDCLQIGIDISREELNKKINARVDKMREDGLESEVRELAKKYSWGLHSMSGIGYKEFYPIVSKEEKNRRLVPFLQKTERLDEIFNEIKKHTRQYAKRQMSFFRRNSRIIWVRDYDAAEKIVKNFLKY